MLFVAFWEMASDDQNKLKEQITNTMESKSYNIYISVKVRLSKLG